MALMAFPFGWAGVFAQGLRRHSGSASTVLTASTNARTCGCEARTRSHASFDLSGDAHRLPLQHRGGGGAHVSGLQGVAGYRVRKHLLDSCKSPQWRVHHSGCMDCCLSVCGQPPDPPFSYNVVTAPHGIT